MKEIDKKEATDSIFTSIEELGYKQELNRGLSLWHMIVFGLLFVIPIAPFGIYGYLAKESNGLVPLVYAIGCVAMVFTALSYGQMARSFPVAGSVYAYASRGINKHIGFLVGWTILLDYILLPALIYIVVGISLNAIVPEIPVYAWSVIFIVLITILNTIGVKSTAKIAVIALIAQLIIYVLFIVFAIFAINKGVNGAHFSVDPIYNAKNFSLTMVMNAVSIAVLSFLGFDAISTLVEETKGDSKVVGRASVSVLVIAGSLFVFLTYIAGALWINFGDFKNIDYAFYEIANLAGGKWLMNLTSFGTAFSWGGAALTAQLAVSRVLFSMSRDKNIPKLFSVIHKKFQTPYIAAWFMGALSLVLSYVFVDDVQGLTLLVNFGALTSFFILHLTVIYHYKLKLKSPLIFSHLIFPLLGAVVIGYVWLNLDNEAKLVGLIWIIAGVIWYVVLRKVFHKDVSNLHV